MRINIKVTSLSKFVNYLREKMRPAYRRFFVYAALNSLDRKVAKYLPDRGIFIEAGANDGLNQSNTLFLARSRSWQGILVEPVPRLFERCKKNRSESFCVNAALVSPEESGVIIDLIDVDLMTSVRRSKNFSFDESHIKSGEIVQSISRKTVSAVGKTISEIISASGQVSIDFLSLDVEGFELEALKGITKEEHFPNFILVETKQIGLVLEVLNNRYELVEILSEHDYFLQLKR